MRISFYITLLTCFATQQLSAQFGNTPMVISRSTNASLFRVTPADLDGDGDTDMLATHENCVVFYENLNGKGSFSSDKVWMEVDFQVFNSSFLGAAFQDMDADGRPDVAADRYWRKNLGGGNFAPRATAFASSLDALCDVNGDNVPDAINHDASKIYWQRNLGNGSFATRVAIKNAASANVFETKDLNFDGKMDFIAGQSNGCFWYKNLGNNQFDTVRLFSFQPAGLQLLDFDSDGKMDVFMASGKSIFWYEIESNEKTTLIQTITTTQFEGGALAIGDMNNDGLADIFAGNTSTITGKRARYFPFNPNLGKFDATPLNHNVYLITHGWATFTNIDGDAEPDMLVGTTYGFGWMKKIAPTQFSAISNITQKLDLPKSIQSSDFENDGDMDLFTNGFVFRHLGNGNYADKLKSSASGSRTFYADLDGDGLKDLARPFGDSISWRKNLGAGQYSQAFLLPGLVTSCKQIGGGDLDQDGDIDLFAANGTDAIAVNARFYWFENDGKGSFTGHLLETGIQLCSGAFSLDVNEDGKLDLVLTFFNGKDIRWYKNFGGGNFENYGSLFAVPSPANANQTMIADLDADGRLDFIYSNAITTQTKVAWFRNLGNATFAPEQSLVTMNHQGSYATPYFDVFDATLDGLPDLIVSDNYWNRFHLVPSAGGGKFGASKVVFDADGFGAYFGVVGHDVDGDGRLDLVFGNRTESINTQGFYQLSWLGNLHPKPVVPFTVNEKSTSCSDNQTPADAKDDILMISLKIKGSDNSSTKFVVTDLNNNTVIDTFEYDKNISFALPPGSAGDGILKKFKVQDLFIQDTFQVLTFESGIPCSVLAPNEIFVSNFRIGCHDNNTPTNHKDDKLVIWLTPRIINPPIASIQFNINSNLGWPIDTAKFNASGKYYQENYFELPDGSAAIDGKLILTIQDSKNPAIKKQIISEVPGSCSGTALPCPISVNYHSQSEIDSFSIKYPGCRVLDGNLTLNEVLPLAEAPSIENLFGFKQILEVRGEVNISHTHLKNLKGLDSLQLVGQSVVLSFFNSPGLNSLSGLNNLRSIGQDFWLADTLATLKNFADLEHLDSIGGGLTLWQMKGLKNFEGLEKLKTGGILAYQCEALENLKGLENLVQSTTISMYDNANLKSLKGLENLKTISGAILSFLQLAKNPLLDDLSALNHDMFIEAVLIEDNPKLSVCAVKAICQYLKNHDPLLTTIAGNLAGCNSIAAVQDACIVSTDESSQEFDFQIFPNPFSEGEPLQIIWKNEISGSLKVEVLSLEGRVLFSFLTSAVLTSAGFLTLPTLGITLPTLGSNSFFVRVSDEKRSATRLVLKR